MATNENEGGSQSRVKEKGRLRDRLKNKLRSALNQNDLDPPAPSLTPNSSTSWPATTPPQDQINSTEQPPALVTVLKVPLPAGDLKVNSFRPIRELWNEAYEDLKSKEDLLIKEYEAALIGDMSAAFPGPGVERQDLMNVIMQKRMAEVKENTWRLNFGRNEVAVKDLAEPVVTVIKWADKYVGDAVKTSPAASIAWAGISLLLPVSAVPSVPCRTVIHLKPY